MKDIDEEFSNFRPQSSAGRRAGKPRQQSSQARGDMLPKSHVQWLGESGQQPWLSPGASGLDPRWAKDTSNCDDSAADYAPCLAYWSAISSRVIPTGLGAVIRASKRSL
ncbi:hypothetical protein TNCV_2791361 [Trichonephila clavipes]|nr:hypothetical protein TNCV_2791361 [Trichonephila clavipes]